MSFTAARITTLAAAFFTLAAATPALAQEAAPAPTGGTQVALNGLTVSPGALLDRTVAIRGQVEESDAGRTVRVERQIIDGSWQQVAATIVEQDGSFRATWKTDQLGRVALRAIVERDATATAAATPLTAQLTVFQGQVASWYGPGFWGRRTACGMRLRKSTVGVAHKTLPCGTMVDFYYRGKTISAPVIDRGPFKAGREWDLTQAAAEQLGVKATVKIGALPPPAVALAAKKRSRTSK